MWDIPVYELKESMSLRFFPILSTDTAWCQSKSQQVLFFYIYQQTDSRVCIEKQKIQNSHHSSEKKQIWRTDMDFKIYLNLHWSRWCDVVLVVYLLRHVWLLWPDGL